MYRARLQQKLRTNSRINPDTSCWEWHGQVSNSGHGKITYFLDKHFTGWGDIN